MFDPEYQEIRTPEDAKALNKLWIPHKPGVILDVEFVTHITETGEEEYHEEKGLAAIKLRLLVTRTSPFLEIEILCRNPIHWNLETTFFSDFVFDRYFDRPRISFLPHFSDKTSNYKAPTSIFAAKFEWRYVEDPVIEIL